MPFVKSECRDPNHIPCSCGDLCFIEYKKLVDAFKAERRWTTIHNEFKRLFDCNDDQAARALAFFVFMYKHGYKYEDEKEAENGSI